MRIRVLFGGLAPRTPHWGQGVAPRPPAQGHARHHFELTRFRDDLKERISILAYPELTLTHNRTDFEKLVRACFDSGQTHYGVIFAVRRPPREIASRLLVILDRVTADEMVNQVRYM